MNKNISRILSLGAIIAVPGMISAQQIIDFESNAGYTNLDVYDTWEDSPFRTGKLTGNFAVVANPFADEVFEEGGDPLNSSAYVLGAQRSRLASNRFGVRVDLEESFKLTPTAKYVHVLIHKPVEGRAMLVGLGSRTERKGQDPYTEQFWEVSNTAVTAGQWCDAVFTAKGAGGIDLRALVIVPDCESPHALTEDFLFYIDNIEINNDPNPRITNEFYLINGDKANWKLNREDRATTAVTLTSPADGNQTVQVPQESDKLVYHDLTDNVLSARPGESLNAGVTFKGTWMHSYVYIDFNNDGKFEPVINDNGTPAENSELLAYSFLGNNLGADNDNGTNSKGQSISGGNRNVLTMPAFTLPATTEPGMYRIRYKVDWNSADPGGNMQNGNNIDANGGAIIDLMLHVHGAEVTVNDQQLNGEVLAADGSKLDALKAPYKQDFTVKMNPEKGFVHNGLTMLCGYNLNGKEIDKYGNRQYFIYTVEGSEFDADGTYTIPASRMAHGNVLIQGNMVEDSSKIEDAPFVDADGSVEIYDLQGRRLNNATHPGLYIVNGAKTIIK